MGIPLRTLLVEDSEDDGLLLEHRLREHGFEPQTARVWTAAALGAALGRQDWDIVLCDFMLPGFDAYRALEIVQGSGRSVPVIVVSGIPGEQMVVELLRRGAADYLSKDRLARLGPSVDQALAYARLQRERARAESEREEFDRRFRGMLETMELLAMTLDREGRVTFCNDALVQWSGWNRQEVLGADWFERFVPGTEENVRKLFFEGVATGSIVSPHQNPIRLKSGELRLVLWHNTILRDAFGRPVGSASIGEDVTDRQRASAALERSEREFKVVFESNPLPMYVFDRRTLRFLAVNDATVKHYGYAREEFLVMSLEEIRPQEDRAALRKFIANRTGGLFNAGTWTHLKRDGTRILVEITSHPLEFQGVAAELVLAKDVTAQRASEVALRESEERFREITESIREVFWLTNPDKTVMLYVSPAYANVWGRPADALYANPIGWFDSIHPDDRERIRRAIPAQQVRGGYSEEYRILRPDGSVRWIHDRAFPVEDASGAIYRIAGVADDITERKRLEEQFRQSQKMEAIGLLSAGVAHDFNNLLTVIKGHIGLLKEKQQLPSEIKTSLDEIAGAADRAAKLTRQLLTFSRQEEMRPSDLNLNGVVSNIGRMIRRLVDERVAIEVNLSPEPLPVRADEGMIEQVLLNLVVNARDAMQGGGVLRIATDRVDLIESGDGKTPPERTGTFACLVVTDTGTGIPPEIIERIFEPFFTTKGAGKGTGLGLATVYGIMQQHGGWVDVQSTVGHGTTFQAFFPRLATPLREALTLKSATPVRGGHEGILVVEDEAAVREVAIAVLADLGYRIFSAASGAEALQVWQLCKDDVQLLLTDMVMPGGIGGRELADRLRTEIPTLAVIFMSGYTRDKSDARAEARDAYLEKPFELVSLARIVRDTLDRKPQR